METDMAKVLQLIMTIQYILVFSMIYRGNMNKGIK